LKSARAAAVVALVVATFIAAAPSSAVPVSAPATCHIQVSGCDAITSDGLCELTDGAALRVWLPIASAGEATFSLDRAPVAYAQATPVQDGTRFELSLPARQGTLWVTVGERACAQRVGIAPPASSAVREARELRARGELGAAADRLRASPEADGPAAISVLARIALARGETDEADALFTQAVQAHEDEGRASSAVDDAFALAYLRLEHRRFAEARAIVERGAGLSQRYPVGLALTAYYRAQLAYAMGDLRGALGGFRDSADRLERLGAARQERIAREGIAAALDQLGRVDDALDTLVALAEEGRDEDGCSRGRLEAIVGWTALHQEAPARVDPGAWLRRALVTYRGECPASYDPAAVASLLGDLASAALARGDFDATEAYLSEAEQSLLHPPPRLLLEPAETRADLALARGDLHLALESYDRVRALAESYGDRDALRIALQGRAEVLVRRGDRAGALTALDQVGEIVDAQSASIPLGEGRESFVRAREQADTRRIELLLDLGRTEQAFHQLRAARARVMAGLSSADRIAALGGDARARWEDAVGAYRRAREAIAGDVADDWRYSAATLADRRARRAREVARAQQAFDEAQAAVAPRRAELPARAAPGELTLGYFAGDGAWYGFAAEGGRVRAARLGAIDPGGSREALARALLAPFAGELARARRLDVVAYGSARSIDVHALPWPRAPLGTTLPVTYPLDLAGAAADPLPSGRALVVGDPSSDLRGARVDLESVIRQLGATPAWSVTTLRGAAATSAAVQRALGAADLFHYSGHARFAGRDGVTSALTLAEDGELSVTDVLALPRVPSRVLLFGCETGRASREARAEGLGLAQAFLLAGARQVVATTRPVDDTVASTIARAVYAHLAERADLSEALRAAQADAWERGVVGWEAFRVLAP
jgi:tetratricopeptide (TPR) repeat protein